MLYNQPANEWYGKHMHPPIKNPDAIIDTALELLEAQGGDFWMLAKGESMSPLIRDGDRIQVRPFQAPPQSGEILIFHRSNGLVAHRLLRLRHNRQGESVCLAQGDHALSPDPPLSLDQVAGRAVAVRRGERELHLDTPAWQRVGGAVSALQLVFSGLGESAWLRRSMRTLIGLLMKIYLRISAL